MYDSLDGIHRGLADDSILDKYDEIRRKIWHDIINPMSSENMTRLYTLDADTAVDNDPFFKLLKQAEQDQELMDRMKHVGCNPLELELIFTSYMCLYMMS